MKKLYFLIVLFILASLNGFGQVIFSEGFEGDGMPAGWITLDADGDGYNWSTIPDNVSKTAFYGSGFVNSSSWKSNDIGALTPDNWLISPEISIPDAGPYSLHYWVCSMQNNYPYEHYGVYVTTSQDFSDTSTYTLLFEETLQPTYSGSTNVQTAWQNHMLSLQAFSGQTVRIAFRHFNCSDWVAIMLDEVNVVGPTPSILTYPESIVFLPTEINHSSVVQYIDYETNNLFNNVSVTSNAPFEVSTDNETFGYEAAVNVGYGQIYVRYLPVEAGVNNGVISFLYNNELIKEVGVSGETATCSAINEFPWVYNFDAVPPMCWDLYSTSTTTWVYETWYSTTWASCTGESVDKTEQLETCTFDFSQVSNMYLSFDFGSNYYYVSNNNIDFKIYVSTDDGVSYNTTPIWSLSEFGSFSAWTPTRASVDLSSLSGESSVKFKFSYEGNSCQVLFGNLFIFPVSPEHIVYVTEQGRGNRDGSSWDNAMSDIQTAVNLASSLANGQVWVAGGTYFGDTLSENAFIMKNGVNVYGGFSGNEPADFDLAQRDLINNTTFLDGQNMRRVLYQPTEFNNETIWDGFTIQNGQTGDGTGSGSGALIRTNGVLSNCIVTGNSMSTGNGGGVWSNGGTVRNCEILNNYGHMGGGGIYAYNSIIDNCNIHHNSSNTSNAAGGGVYANSTTIRNCFVHHNIANSGSGIYALFSTISCTNISHNEAAYTLNCGGCYMEYSSMYNCLVENNDGVGLMCQHSCVISNTNIVRNEYGIRTYFNDGENIFMHNSIVWGNATDLYSVPGLVMDYCAVNALPSNVEVGVGNIIFGSDGDLAPMFMYPSQTTGMQDNTVGVDWHLQNGSFCVNRGYNEYVTEMYDLSGQIRIQRDTVDMGCYESDYYSSPLPSLIVQTNSMNNITHNTAECMVSFFNNNNPEISCGVCWSTSPNPTVNDAYNLMVLYGISNNQGFLLSDLNPNTTYYVRGFVIYNNETIYGNELTFTTFSCAYTQDIYETVCTEYAVYEGGVVIMSESFDEGVMPDGWSNIDADGDGYGWNTAKSYNTSDWTNHTGSGCVSSSSWDENALTPDNWLITPALQIPAEGMTVFSWWAAPNDASWPAEHYAVYVSANTNSISDFINAGSVYEETISTGGYFQHSIDLTSKAGQTVYVAFRHYDCTDMYWLNIDDVTLENILPTVYYTESGNYTYTVLNEYGCQDTFNLHLTVLNNYPSVTTYGIYDVGLHSAVGWGEVTNNCDQPIIEMGLCYSTEHNPTIQDQKSYITNPTDYFYSLALAGLEEGTTYYVRAYATNSAGTAYGEEVTFTTLNSASVNGIVTDATTNNPIAGASVSVFYEDNNNPGFVTTVLTDAYGNFSLTDVVEGNYNFVANASGYEMANQYALLVPGNGNSVSLSLTPKPCQVPVNVDYELIAGDETPSLQLTWEMTADTLSQAYGSDFQSGVGAGAQYTMGAFHVFSPEQLVPYNGGVINSVGAYFNGSYEYTTYTVQIWTSDYLDYADNLVYEQVVNSDEVIMNAWNDIQLNTPFAIDGTKYLFVGFWVECNGPVGTRIYSVAINDYGNMNYWYGNAMLWNDNWVALSNVGVPNYNWMIRATVIPNNITYNVYENGTAIAQNVEGNNYVISSYNPQQEQSCYQVAANCVNGQTSELSECATVLQTLPTVITHEVSDVRHNSAMVRGEVTDNGNGEITQYGFCYSTMPHPTLTTGYYHYETDNIEGEFTLNISYGMSPQTTYYVRAFATNSLGTAYGNELMFTTLEECHTPVSLAVSDVLSSSAFVHWQNDEANGGSPEYYELQYKLADADEWTTISNITDEYYMLTGLTQQSSYMVRVRAVCETDRESAYTEEMGFTTLCISGNDEVIIGEGTNTYYGDYFPVTGYNVYSYTQQIYDASEIGEARTIDHIAVQYFYVDLHSWNVDIYLGHTNKSSFASASDWVPYSDLTLVYSGDITFDNSGEDYWFDIPLTQTFEYNGIDNLVIVFDNNSQVSLYENGFYTHYKSEKKSLWAYSYSDINPSEMVYEYSELPSYRNNLKIPGSCYTEGCDRANLVVREVTDSSVTLLCAASNDNEYELQYAEVGSDDYITIENTTSGVPYILSGLDQYTRYVVRIRSICGPNEYSDWKTVTFTTSAKYMERLYVNAQSNFNGDGSSWANATTDLVWALNAAKQIHDSYNISPEIWVAEGTYYGNTSSNNAFSIAGGVKLYGGFAGTENSIDERNITAHPTVLDGQETRRVIRQTSAGHSDQYDYYPDSLVIDGFTVRNGYANGSDGSNGGGAYLSFNFWVNNCRFENNRCNDRGGAVYVAGGRDGDIAYGFDHCVFTGNQAHETGGAVCDDYQYADYYHCVFQGNTSENYAGGVRGGRAFVNCAIIGNHANQASGGIQNVGKLMLNCDIVGNTSNSSSYGIGLREFDGALVNCVIWGNKALYSDDNYNISVNYNMRIYNSAVEGGCNDNYGNSAINLASDNDGSENGLLYPFFVDPASGDYRLRDNSALIDAGLNDISDILSNYGLTGLYIDSSDLYGLARYYGDAIDIGCYENHNEQYCINPYGLTATDITGSSALLSWNSNNVDNLDHYLLEYRQEGSDNWSQAVELTTDHYMLSGLQAYTTYEARVRAYCMENNSSDWASVTFTTNCPGNYAEEVVIGTNDYTWTRFPIYHYYPYSYTQQIYLSDEIGEARTIDTIMLQYYSGDPLTRHFSIYLGHTDKEYFDNSAFSNLIRTGLELVYEGDFTFNNSGENNWVAIPLQNVFEYNGTDNLVLVFKDNNGNGTYYSYNYYFYGSYTDYSRSVYYGSYYEVDPEHENYNSGGTSTFRNNIRFEAICEEGCDRANLAVTEVTDSSALLYYVAGNGSTGYELQYRMVGEEYTTLTPTANPYRLEGLVQNTAYEVRIRSLCSDQENSRWITRSFTTGVKPLNRLYVTTDGTGDASSWGQASNNLAWTVNTAARVKEMFGIEADVWVAQGTYKGDSVSASAFTMVEGVDVYGGFEGIEPEDYDLSQRDFTAHATILDGQNSQRVLNQAEHFVVPTTWDGFTLQNGYCPNNNSDINYGGGAYLRQLSTLRHCRIINNTAYNGGGVYVEASYYNNAVLDHCEIDHNSAYYCGCGVYSGYAQIRHCFITHNYPQTNNNYTNGGGVFIANAGNNSGQHAISNCLIANNSSKYYGGVYITGSNAYIDNTTIVNNSALNSPSNGGCGGLYSSDYTTYLNNCIIWGNKAGGFSSNLSDHINCKYCAVEEIANGDDNIVLTSENNQSGELYCPRFVNPAVTAGADDETANVDWHLAEGSVCVNRGGNDLVVLADSLDLDGNARIQMQTVDMGCYESAYEAITLPEYNGIVYVTETGAGSMDGTSWDNALASLTEALAIAYMNDADIWVAEGTYYGDNVSPTAFPMVEGVNVYGGFAGTENSLEEREYSAHPTILDGQNNQRLLCQNSEFNTYTVWDGLTLRNGHAQYEYNSISSNSGGGAFLRHGSKLRNCLITQNYASVGGGVYVNSNYYNIDTTFIINCKFSHNTSSSYGGGAYFSYRTFVQNSVFEYNTSGNRGGGVYLSDNYCLLSNCLIANNTANNANGAGVFINSSENIINSTTIVNNLISSSYQGAGIYSNYTNSTITNSIVWGNKKDGEPDGIQGSYNASYVASDNICSGEHNIILSLDNNGTDVFAPRFVNPSATAGSADVTDNADWHLQQGSPCVNHGDNSIADAYDLDGNTRVQQDTVDLGCYESPYNSVALPTYNGIVYVKEGGAGAMDGTSWDNAVASVRTAVNLAAMNNAMVWVAAGTYHGDGTSENAFVMLPGVNVYGGFAGTEDADYDLNLRDFDENTTILDGQYAQRVLCQREHFSENTAATWDGFTIQNGQVLNGNGAGVYLRGYGTISHCRILNNTIANSNYYGNYCYGAGVYANGSNTSNKAKVIHCVIQYNGFENCYYSYGGGLYARYADISHTEISYNNAVYGGGGVYVYLYSNFSNCLIYSNTATVNGGGVYVYDYNNSFVNCDIVNNSVSNNGNGGGIRFNTSYYNTVTNSIIWGNKKGYTVNNMNGSVGTISYCAVEEGYDGLGNISLASANDGIDGTQYYVRFIDPANNDYQLHPTSSCIDLGNSEVVTDTVDFYGNTRIYGGMVDIGCSEIQEESSCPSVINPQVSNITTTNAQLSWHPVGNESQWIVVYGEVNGSETSMTVTDTTCTLTGLNLNRNYIARVRAVCGEGAMSVFSLPVNFQTNCDPDMLEALGEFTNFSPANGNIIDANGVTFAWNNVANATSYDFYLWQSTGTMPSVPSRHGLTQPMVESYYLPDFSPGKIYYWKVVAWNECISDTSEQLSIQVSPDPDLHVTSITHGDARVGQTMTIAWTVKNDGEGRTPNGARWTEYVWLAQDCDVRYYDSHDRLLATVENQQQLQAGESYTTSEMTVTIPNDIDPGSYYLFVFADQPDAYNINFDPTGGVAPDPYQPSVTGDPYPYLTGHVHFEGNIHETVEHDNFFYVVLNIMPPPSPDLLVSAVTHGGNAISGTSTNVTWTVENRGEAAAMGSWIDVVYLSADTVLDTSSDLLLGRYVHENGLALNDNYQRTEEVTIPVEYNGDYYFIVYTDNTNTIYEGLLENNNKNISQPMHVTLTWMTDLQVASVNMSADNTVDANGYYNCEFTIVNEGSSPTYVNRWTDAIYISEEPVFDRASAIRLDYVNHNEVLNSLDSYTVSRRIQIPGNISGQWYLFVETDVNNEVFEYNADDNNVYSYLPALDVVNPDMEVTTIVLPEVINPNERQTVQWTVRNNGPGNLVNRSFTDYFYFNGSQIYNASVSYVSIPVGDSIVRTATIQLPCSNTSATADMLTISTDVTNSVLEAFETNNEKSVYLTVSTPDLTVNSIITTDEPGTTNVSLWSGTTAELWYNVANNGDVSAVSSNITDKIYFNTSADSYQESDLIYANTHAMNIGAGENETYSCTVTIPNGISGTYYYHVVTNAGAELCEGGAMGNNSQTSTAVEVQLSPSPDLVMSSLVAPASVYLGADFILTYTILNQGDAALSHTTVSQRFYYSMSPTAYDSRNVLTTTNDYLNLAVNESVTNSVTVNLPVNNMSGTYYIHAVTDYNDQVYEYNGEDNNTTVSNNILASAYQLDLQLTQVDGPAEMQWGQTATYTLHVHNNSSLPTLANSWYDVIYLSDDEVLHGSDRLMQQVNHNTVLEANGDYTVEIQVTIPYGTPSTAYLIAITDYTSRNVDINTSNNVLVKTLSVSSVPTPDLAVSETEVLDAVVAGQLARIAYTVTNVGEIPVEQQTWNDKVFVSFNNSYESNDLQLLTQNRQNVSLAQNESYRDTLNFTIPLTYSGNLYLLMMANANNDPYEINHANNMEAVAVNVTVPLPGDLIVTDVVCQNSIVSGNVLHAVWTIKNIGDNPISGNGLRSLVYVSADTVFDANDRLLGRVTSDNIHLGVDATMQQSMDARLTGVAAGDYYLIVKTDVTNAFNEVSDDNNMGRTIDPFAVTIRPLPFNTDVYDTLINDEVSDYMLTVGDQVSQTVRIHVTSEDSLLGAVNMIYATYNGMGSNLNYSYSTIGQYQANSELYIPSTQQGYYGVNIYGTTPTNQPQNTIVRADILPFELREVNDNHGGNTGVVTVELTGSRFRPDMTVCMRNGNEVICADTLIYVNYYQVFVQFDLTGRTPGVYDMSAVNFCEGEAVLANAFTIEEGQPSGLSYNLLFPSSPRPNRNIVMMLEYGNTGNVDLRNQVLEITSNGGSPIALTPEGLNQNRTVLRVPLSIEGEPDGLLRPGSYGTLNVYCYSSGALIFSIKPVEE